MPSPSSRVAKASQESHRAHIDPTPHPANNTYFPALDGIRALAFLMVFAIHYLEMPWGWAGVNVFFVLSGFLITGILYDTRNQLHRVRNFYVRRTLRIFPLYYGLMLLLVLLYPIFHWQWSWKWLIWPLYLGNLARFFPPGPYNGPFWMLDFAQPLSRTFPRVQLYFGHFWSLCVEEQFYLLWPWVVFWIKDRRALLRLCAASVLLIPLLRVLAAHILPQAAIDNAALTTATPLPFDALFLGGFVALVRRGPWAARALPFARRTFASLSAAIMLWIAYELGVNHSIQGFTHPSWAFTWAPCGIDVLSACLIVMAIERGSRTFRLFNLRGLRWLGRISYGAYVFHDILHAQIYRLVRHFIVRADVATALVALIFTLAVAAASFEWFESPFIRLKERWTIRAHAT